MYGKTGGYPIYLAQNIPGDGKHILCIGDTPFLSWKKIGGFARPYRAYV